MTNDVASGHRLAAEYAGSRGLFDEFSRALSELLGHIAREEHLAIQSVSHRAKDVPSLSQKVLRPGAHYETLEDVTDLAGVRIITYFADDVDRMAELVHREFDIDRKNSVDKRVVEDPERFGYASLHFVLRLSTARSELREYRRFANLKAELQIRSLLQHTWAEIEHDLGYKSKNAVPITIRRRFVRLAGLLELADTEFCSIRGDLDTYARDVKLQISEGEAAAALDQVSMQVFVNTDSIVHEIDRTIAQHFEDGLGEPDAEAFGRYVENLAFFDIRDLGTLSKTLYSHRDLIGRFAAVWLGPSKEPDGVMRGICLFYLGYVLAAELGTLEQVNRYLEQRNIGPGHRLAERVLSTYAACSSGRAK